MAAAAFKVSMKVANSAGQTKIIPLTVSDVNGEYALFPSGGSELPLSTLPSVIADMVFTAAGTDTSQMQVFINGVNTGIVIYNATNLGTVYNRQVQGAPIAVPAGGLVKFKQVT